MGARLGSPCYAQGGPDGRPLGRRFFLARPCCRLGDSENGDVHAARKPDGTSAEWGPLEKSLRAGSEEVVDAETLETSLQAVSEDLLAPPKGKPLKLKPTAEEEEKEKATRDMEAERRNSRLLNQDLLQMNTAENFRHARKILRNIGMGSLRDQLAEQGFLDANGRLSTSASAPFNVFARIADGELEQGPEMVQEQLLLGKYQARFVVCKNLQIRDDHWESTDPEWVGRASMSKRHRFLTVRDLRWDWFNALALGLVSGIGEAVELLEEMQQAALLYSSKAEGWSKNPGFFFHVFDHSTVNSLHLHMVDMDHLGPSYTALAFKNMPLDVTLAVLKEEQEKVVKDKAALAKNTAKEVFSQQTQLRMNTAEDFRRVRKLLRLFGVGRLRDQLADQGFLDNQGRLNTGAKPFNIFARLASGQMEQGAEMAAENLLLGKHAQRFMVCQNRAECDANWENSDPEWVGRASMSKRHRFLTVRDLRWDWFNVLTFGLVSGLSEAVGLLEKIREAVLVYTSKAEGWSKNPGFFFHVFDKNSVNSLHLHMIDMDALGPSYAAQAFKNMPLDVVISVLKDEEAEAWRFEQD